MKPPITTRPDGSKYRVLGYVWEDGQWRCPTDKCNAFCCRTGALLPHWTPPCAFLTEGNRCWFQMKGGVGAKPFGCVTYPRSQSDVDHMNRNADGDFRCYLSVEEID